MKKMFNEGNQIHNFMSSSGSTTLAVRVPMKAVRVPVTAIRVLVKAVGVLVVKAVSSNRISVVYECTTEK
jgi:hypothetical protein